MYLDYNIKTNLNKFFVKVPEVKNSTTTTIYIKKGDGPPPTPDDDFFIFYEDGYKFSQWTTYGGGTLYSDVATFGQPVILKDDNCDPNGGVAPVKEVVDYFKIIFTTRRDVSDTCYANRGGLVNDSGNGYGWALSYTSSPYISIDYRTNYSGTPSNSVSVPLQYGKWYYGEFYITLGSQAVLDLYDFDTMQLLGSTSGDVSIIPMTTSYIFGGKPYYVDNIYIIRWTDLTINVTEILPNYLWQVDITNPSSSIFTNFYIELDPATFGVTSDSDIYLITETFTFLLFSPTGSQDVYYYNGTSFVSLGKTRSELTELDFYTYGSVGMCDANKAAYESLSTSVDVLVYDPFDLTTNLELRKIPYEYSIVQVDGIDVSSYLSIQALEFTTTGSGVVKCLVSKDGIDWYRYNTTDNVWELYVSNPDPNDITLAQNIINDGMDNTFLTNLTPTILTEFFGTPPDKVYFMFAFQYNVETDNALLTEVKLYVDAGSDYEIVPYTDVDIVQNIGSISVTINSTGYYLVNYLD